MFWLLFSDSLAISVYVSYRDWCGCLFLYQKAFSIAPNTRTCKTNTPLEPIAAFLLCNVAQIQSNGSCNDNDSNNMLPRSSGSGTGDSANLSGSSKVIDPFCGSGASLLAAALIVPDCTTVGIDIASKEWISRDDIIQDFTCRKLNPPVALLVGDSTRIFVDDDDDDDKDDNETDDGIEYNINDMHDDSDGTKTEKKKDSTVLSIQNNNPRFQALQAIIPSSSSLSSTDVDRAAQNNKNNKNGSRKHDPLIIDKQNVYFDAIVADPPYGIREAKGDDGRPLEELFLAMIDDATSFSLLKPNGGGRLVAFVPVTDEERLEDKLPSTDITKQAGLILQLAVEQPLNEKLSRWLVSYVCRHNKIEKK